MASLNAKWQFEQDCLQPSGVTVFRLLVTNLVIVFVRFDTWCAVENPEEKEESLRHGKDWSLADFRSSAMMSSRWPAGHGGPSPRTLRTDEAGPCQQPLSKLVNLLPLLARSLVRGCLRAAERCQQKRIRRQRFNENFNGVAPAPNWMADVSSVQDFHNSDTTISCEQVVSLGSLRGRCISQWRGRPS